MAIHKFTPDSCLNTKNKGEVAKNKCNYALELDLVDNASVSCYFDPLGTGDPFDVRVWLRPKGVDDPNYRGYSVSTASTPSLN